MSGFIHPSWLLAAFVNHQQYVWKRQQKSPLVVAFDDIVLGLILPLMADPYTKMEEYNLHKAPHVLFSSGHV